MEKQEMEVEWKLETENGNGNWKQKMEMEIGNGNIKVAGLLAALINLRVVACCSYALPSFVRCGNE